MGDDRIGCERRAAFAAQPHPPNTLWPAADASGECDIDKTNTQHRQRLRRTIKKRSQPAQKEWGTGSANMGESRRGDADLSGRQKISRYCLGHIHAIHKKRNNFAWKRFTCERAVYGNKKARTHSRSKSRENKIILNDCLPHGFTSLRLFGRNWSISIDRESEIAFRRDARQMWMPTKTRADRKRLWRK